MRNHFTTGELVIALGVPDHAVRRAIDSLAPPVPRVGLYRVLPADQLDALKAELTRRGYALREGETVHA